MPLDQLSTPAAGLFPEFQHLELLAGQVDPADLHHFCILYETVMPDYASVTNLDGVLHVVLESFHVVHNCTVCMLLPEFRMPTCWMAQAHVCSAAECKLQR